MNLSRKTALYSIVLCFIIIVFFIGYLYFLLPDLYVKHAGESHVEALLQQHQAFLDTGAYLDDSSTPSLRMMTFTLPEDATQNLKFHTANMHFELESKDPRIDRFLNQTREYLERLQAGEVPEETPDWEALSPLVTQLAETAPFQIHRIDTQASTEAPQIESHRFTAINDYTMLLVSQVRMEGNQFATNILLTRETDGWVISVYPSVAGSIHQIIPVVLQSLPMLALWSVVIILAASLFFSRSIVQPIIRVSEHAHDMQHAGYQAMEPLHLATNDEIAQLAESLNHLYIDLSAQYRALEHETKGREIFLQASSHQLNTPITASLLLVEGMIDKVGKYKDRDRYLPILKEELIKMRRIVSSILAMRRKEEALPEDRTEVDVFAMAERTFAAQQVLIDQKQLHIELTGSCVLRTHADLLQKILDNIIENAVRYTAQGGTISLRATDRQGLRLSNGPTQIAPADLARAKEPFVSYAPGGSGLGLYFASYYADILDMDLELELDGQCVITTLHTSS